MSFQLIASGSLSGSLASITSIPQDGTDLLLYIQARTTASTTNATFSIGVNGSTNSVYDGLILRGQPAVSQTTASTYFGTFPGNVAEIPGTQIGSNNVSTIKIYFTNYTSANQRPWMTEQTMLGTTSNSPINMTNSRTSETNAITSIQIREQQSSLSGTWSLYKITAS